MDGDLVGRLAGSRRDNGAARESVERLDGVTALMLDLVQRDGTRTALSYSYLVSIRFEAGGALTLEFVGHTVTISGRNLEPVYIALKGHTAQRIAESASEFDDGKAEVFVETIDIRGEEAASQER